MSVASAAEAATAMRGGAEILDVKDPRQGSLGPASPRVVRAARDVAGRRQPVTAALGDDAWRSPERAARLARLLFTEGADLVKAGTAGLPPGRAAAALRSLRERVEARADAAVAIVAVGFADDPAADPFHERWLRAVAEAGLTGAMLDTLDKRRSLTARRGESDLRRWVARARRLGLTCGLAGGLRLTELPAVARLGADVIGVRGAVCEGGRGSDLSEGRVRHAVSAVAEARARSARSRAGVVG